VGVGAIIRMPIASCRVVALRPKDRTREIGADEIATTIR
jgi:hypothetical protein